MGVTMNGIGPAGLSGSSKPSGLHALSRAERAQLPSLLEFQSPSAALLHTPVRGPAKTVIWTVASLFVSCAAAAGLIPIDKVVTAQGRVVAITPTVVLQPLETSIVRSIAVTEGQIVHKGDLLARLDPTFTNADMGALVQQTASLKAEVDRLQAEAAGRDYRPATADAYTAVQQSIFAQRQLEHGFRRENYSQKIDSLKAAVQRATGDIQAYASRYQVANSVEQKRMELERLQVGSQLNSLAAKDSRLEVQRGLQQAIQQAEGSRRDLSAMEAEASATDQDWHAKVSQDLTDQSRKLSDAQENLHKAQLRHQLVELRADDDATVQSIARVSTGSVLQSGDQFITMVPLNAPLEVEATVGGGDAGFVHVGNKVTVKFDTFPYQQYGGAEGTVRTVSPDSFNNSQAPEDRSRGPERASQLQPGGQTFYRSHVTLDKITLHDTPNGFHVTPGMPVTADVMVGKRTVLSYIFSRALPVAMDGMREP
jgi:hemolysin D